MFMFKTIEMLRGLSWIMRGKLLWVWTYCLIKPLLRTLESRTYCTSPYISGYLCGACITCITLSFLIWANEYKCVCGIICVNRLSKANMFANWPMVAQQKHWRTVSGNVEIIAIADASTSRAPNQKKMTENTNVDLQDFQVDCQVHIFFYSFH